MKLKGRGIALFVIWLAACSPASSPSPTITATLFAIPTTTPFTLPPTETLTPSPDLSATSQPPTPDSTPTLNEPSGLEGITRICPEVLSDFPPDQGPGGVLIYAPPGNTELAGSIFLYDLESRTEHTVSRMENEWLSPRVAVSPNKSMMAYLKIVSDDTDSQEDAAFLVIADANGQTLVSLPYPLFDPQFPEEGQWKYFSWLNNQELIITEYTEFGPDKALVLNPMSGAKVRLDPSGRFDYFDSMAQISLVQWGPIMIFNSDLTKVIYPGLTENFEESLVLWDIENNQMILNLPSMNIASRDEPEWSPDNTLISYGMSLSEQMSPTVRQEIFVIDNEGTVTQLTQLNEANSSVVIIHHNWSPDSRKIAFEADLIGGRSDVELAVVQIESKETTGYCSISENNTGPIWSPDGNYLFVSGSHADQVNSSLFVLDLERNIAVKIGESMIPVGWMAQISD